MKINPVAMNILQHPDSPLNAVSYTKEIELLREMADSSTGGGKVQMSLEHFVVPERRKYSKKDSNIL